MEGFSHFEKVLLDLQKSYDLEKITEIDRTSEKRESYLQNKDSFNKTPQGMIC